MTIANAISSTLSGLSARSREAGVVSSNIANATTPGYARRDVELSSGAHGTVRIDAVRRAEDTRLSGELRMSEASRAGAEVSRDSLRRIERAFGAPDQPGSLGARMARLEATLTDAASDPSSEARLRAVSEALVDLTDGIRAASDAIRDARTGAEAGIEKDTRAVEEGLRRVAGLNVEIARGRALGRDVTALEDRRRAEIDTLAQSVPVKAYERQDGMMSLVAEGGVMLLESSRPAEIAFDAAGLVTPAMTVGAPLDTVRVRGEATDPATPGGRLSGGTLGAHVALRDRTLPELQSRLDAFAADLAARLGPDGPTGAGGPDPTLAPGDAGLLTDFGAAVAAAPAAGLAGRLEVNQAARTDPWRLRDGIAAPGPGRAGDSSLLRGLAAALSEPTAPPAGFAPGSRNPSELLADVVSGVASSRLGAEALGARHSAMAETLRQEERVGGVDTDVELQRLMEIERGYAASARVLQAVDEMLGRILEI